MHKKVPDRHTHYRDMAGILLMEGLFYFKFLGETWRMPPGCLVYHSFLLLVCVEVL